MSGKRGRPRIPMEQRFWHKVDKSDACWLWTASLNSRGYGLIGLGRKLLLAHRVSYEMAHGPIAEGLVIDHMCHNQACVNPAHLQAVSQKQNSENRVGSNGITGIRGVYPATNSSKFQAVVVHERKRYYLGTFPTRQAAENAVIAKRNELFTNNLLDRETA